MAVDKMPPRFLTVEVDELDIEFPLFSMGAVGSSSHTNDRRFIIRRRG
jgi:hypothetical protein